MVVFMNMGQRMGIRSHVNLPAFDSFHTKGRWLTPLPTPCSTLPSGEEQHRQAASLPPEKVQ
jgi:hypothetical protein